MSRLHRYLQTRCSIVWWKGKRRGNGSLVFSKHPLWGQGEPPKRTPLIHKGRKP